MPMWCLRGLGGCFTLAESARGRQKGSCGDSGVNRPPVLWRGQRWTVAPENEAEGSNCEIWLQGKKSENREKWNDIGIDGPAVMQLCVRDIATNIHAHNDGSKPPSSSTNTANQNERSQHSAMTIFVVKYFTCDRSGFWKTVNHKTMLSNFESNNRQLNIDTLWNLTPHSFWRMSGT